METTMATKRLGYWISAKKSKKLSLSDIEDALRDRNIEPVRIDLNLPWTGQGAVDGFLHKLTDVIAKADQGDEEACTLLSNFETCLEENPNIIVIDPIESIRLMMNRFKTYSLIQNCDFDTKETVFVPAFVVLDSSKCDFRTLMRRAKVEFPVVSKPILSHGSAAHEMTLVFNERGLLQCHFPCLIQSFVNHNAILYKLFAIGEQSFMVKRPSIKNLFASEDIDSIDFHSDDISKPESSSQLTLQNLDEAEVTQEPCPDVLNSITKSVHRKLKVGLFGVDVVVVPTTGQYAIIDINVFPGYDGVPDFPDRIAAYIRQQLDKLDNHDSSQKWKSVPQKNDVKPNRIEYNNGK